MANPYHDKEGKFTSKGNQGSAEPKQEIKKTVSKIQLKPGVDLSNFPAPQQVKRQSVPERALLSDNGKNEAIEDR